MRSFEIASAIGALILSLLCMDRTKLGFGWKAFVILVVAVAIVHGLVEGPRIHMAFVYAAILALLVLTLTAQWQVPRLLNGWIPVFAVLGIGFSAYQSAVAHPVFRFPRLTGPYASGRSSFHWIDPGRKEKFGEGGTRQREVMVEVWYPAIMAEGAKPAPYLQRELVGKRDSQLLLVKTRSYLDLEVAQPGSGFPVLLFSPRLGGSRFQNTYMFEELASHGYIIFSVDHPYSSGKTVFPDGRVIPIRLGFLDFSSESAYSGSVTAVEADVSARAADLRFVLDQIVRLAEGTQPSRFAGRLDLSKAGVMGHSVGASAASEACRLDTRFRACLNLDGWFFGELKERGIDRPFFVMIDNTPRPSPIELSSKDLSKQREAQRIEDGFVEYERSLSKYGGYKMDVSGLAHENYSDEALYSGSLGIGSSGKIDPQLAHKIINEYTLAFFNRHLLNRKEALLEAASSPYEAVRFRPYQQVLSNP